MRILPGVIALTMARTRAPPPPPTMAFSSMPSKISASGLYVAYSSVFCAMPSTVSCSDSVPPAMATSVNCRTTLFLMAGGTRFSSISRPTRSSAICTVPPISNVASVSGVSPSMPSASIDLPCCSTPCPNNMADPVIGPPNMYAAAWPATCPGTPAMSVIRFLRSIGGLIAPPTPSKARPPAPKAPTMSVCVFTFFSHSGVSGVFQMNLSIDSGNAKSMPLATFRVTTSAVLDRPEILIPSVSGALPIADRTESPATVPTFFAVLVNRPRQPSSMRFNCSRSSCACFADSNLVSSSAVVGASFSNDLNSIESRYCLRWASSLLRST